VNVLPLNILLPEIGSSSEQVLPYARCLLDSYGGQATLLSIVEVAEDRSLSEGALTARRRRGRLKKLADLQGEAAFRAEVRTAHSYGEAVRSAVLENNVNLMLLRWRSSRQKSKWTVQEGLVDNPPCDIGVIKHNVDREIRTVLVAARGGPHARLALRIAEGIAASAGAVLTLLHINAQHWNPDRRAKELEYFSAVVDSVRYEQVRPVQVDAQSVETVLLEQAAQHDLVVMGASGRDDTSPYLFGRIPTTIAQRINSTVIIVKTQEPVTGKLFGVPAVRSSRNEMDISEIVDRWFAENTFHSSEFSSLRYLVDLKERQGTSISLALPTLNEEKTVGKIVSTIKKQLMERYPLIDEFIVVDSNSVDRTVEIVTSLGIPVVNHPDILPGEGTYRGKGEALWKSLHVTTGDILVWIDSDITGFNPKFVYGLLGPLLTQPHLGFVKGFYRRPLNLGGHISTTGGGRVTELTARPLINLFYPQLSGLVQPLAGEMAGRRQMLEAVPFFTGYGVETGLLIDILERFGLRSIAQTDLEVRVHRNQTLLSLSKMAFAIVQVVVKRLGEGKRLQLLEDVNTSMKLIHYAPTELFLEVQEVRENERPPMETVPDYRSSRERNVVMNRS
jgi:glycosyltransferase involved in cell wall biosynthesis/nucleotide-binding universal stress UspA family protein